MVRLAYTFFRWDLTFPSLNENNNNIQVKKKESAYNLVLKEWRKLSMVAAMLILLFSGSGKQLNVLKCRFIFSLVLLISVQRFVYQHFNSHFFPSYFKYFNYSNNNNFLIKLTQ